MKTTEETDWLPDEGIETIPVDTLKAYYLDQLKTIVHHAYVNSPALRRKWDQAGFSPADLTTIEDMEKIPILKKQELKNSQAIDPPFGGFLAVAMSNIQRIYVSPGPIYDPEEIGNRRLREAKIMLSHGFGPGEKVMVTLSYHMVPAGLLFDKALREAGATVIPAGVGGTELQLQAIKDLRVTGYIGTGTFLMNLIKKAEEKGLDIEQDFTIKRALLTAEGVSPALRKELEEVYNIYTWQGYGTADIGFFAYECDRKSGMHIAEDVYVEIVDPETGKSVKPGETGEVIVTHFNRAYPLIRFGTGDLSLLETSRCECGRTSPRLLNLVGRVDDSFKVRGLFIYGAQMRTIMSDFEDIHNYSMVISKAGYRDMLTLKVALKNKDAVSEKLSEKLLSRVKEICGLKPDSVEFVDKTILGQEVKPLVDARKRK